MLQVGHAAEAPAVFVEVQADGVHCVVRKVKILCADVLPHLRNALDLAPGTWVRFRASRSAPYQAVKAVMDAVSASEFSTSVAYPRDR